VSEPSKNPFDILLEQIRQIVREEITMAIQNGALTVSQQDTLLSPEKAAELMGVAPRWLYRHAAKLPFTRRISRKNLRFSEAGLRRWLGARKPDSRR
jgi:predicted DNA-binding transcriptional regulator AlpA